MLEHFSLPKKVKPVPPVEKFPWDYDSDVIDTGKSLDTAEGSTGGKLTYGSVAVSRGMDMIFENNAAYSKQRQGLRANSPTDVWSELSVNFI